MAWLDYRRLATAVGSRPLSLLRGDLERALYEELGDGVDLRLGCAVDTVGQSPDKVVASLSDASRCQADLLVEAEGIPRGRES